MIFFTDGISSGRREEGKKQQKSKNASLHPFILFKMYAVIFLGLTVRVLVDILRRLRSVPSL